jgi:hypothetical protein
MEHNPMNLPEPTEELLPMLIDPETDRKITNTLIHIHNLRRTSYLFTWRLVLYFVCVVSFGALVYISRYLKEQKNKQDDETRLESYISDKLAVPTHDLYPSGTNIPDLHVGNVEKYTNPLVDLYGPVRVERENKRSVDILNHMGIGASYQG